MRLRDRIELVASKVFDSEEIDPIRIFAKHVEGDRKRRPRDLGSKSTSMNKSQAGDFSVPPDQLTKSLGAVAER